jgi:low affinity Fe/Cu permease
VFARLSRAVEHAAGSPWAVGLAAALIVVLGWQLGRFSVVRHLSTLRQYFHYNLVTFILAFIIQGSQVRQMTGDPNQAIRIIRQRRALATR